MKSAKELDKFYTNQDIAKKFVEVIDNLSPLRNFQMVIEPSAGSGNILTYLPPGSIGLDLHPESDSIIEQDFFEYYPESYHPIYSNIDIACVGNPPFGKGYMNPLAKAFFNHAATFSTLIAFIVPAKWHTSWKVHKQLNKDFGLYYSEILPKNSFTLNEKPYDVNCCMQVWSKTKLGSDLRIKSAPPTKHEDFDLFLTCDKVPGTQDARNKLKEKVYWTFGLKYWGKIAVCDIEDIEVDTTTHFLFSPRKPYVRKVFENVDWNNYIYNMGAPNVGGKSIIIRAYMDTKEKLGITD